MIGEKNRDYYAGALVAFVGVGASVIAFRYNIGSLTRMGPGFFPFYLGILLASLGGIIAISNFFEGGKAPAAPSATPKLEIHSAMQTKPDWRGWGCIIGGVLAFIFLADSTGLLAATFCCVFIACWGDKTAQLEASSGLPLGITVFGVILFANILKVQIPLYRDGWHVTAMLVLCAVPFVFLLIRKKTSAVSALLAAVMTAALFAATAAAIMLLGAVLALLSRATGWTLPEIGAPSFANTFLISGLAIFATKLLAGGSPARGNDIMRGSIANIVNVYGVEFFVYFLLVQTQAIPGAYR